MTVEASRRHEEAIKKFVSVLTTVNNMLSGDVSPIDAERMLRLTQVACETMLGEDLSTVAREATDAMRRVTNLLACNEQEIRQIMGAYRRDVPGVRLDDIAAWDRVCERVIALQTAARSDPVKLATYAGRDADAAHAGDVLDIQWFQVAFHDLRFLADYPNSLLQAEPGTGKTTHARISVSWELGNWPELRFLLLLASNETAAAELSSLRDLMRTGEYRAVFPWIRILGRAASKEKVRDKEEQQKARATAKQFSVGRKNQAYAREPSVIAFGATSNFEGRGFERIEIDDPQSDRAYEERWMRNRVIENIEGCGANRLRRVADARIRGRCTPKSDEDWAARICKGVAGGSRPSWKVCIKPFFSSFDESTGEYKPLWSKTQTPASLKEKSYSAHFKNEYLGQMSSGATQVIRHLCYYPCDPDDQLWPMVRQRYGESAVQLMLSELSNLRNGHQYLSIDPSGTRGKQSSKTAVGRWCLTAEGHLYLLRVDLRPGDMVGLREWVIEQIVGPKLFAERFVRHDDRDEVKLAKRLLWTHKEDAQGNLAGVVIESTGGQAVGTQPFNVDVPNQIAEMGIVWKGTMEGFRAKRLGELASRQNIGKEARLRECATFLQNRYVFFPGKWCMDPFGREVRGYQRMDDGPICGAVATLVDQIIHFDRHRTNDGVDMVTEMILHFAARHALNRREPRVAPGPAGMVVAPNALSELMRKQMALLWEKPSDDGEEGKELQWLESACA
jgi:hypothetical protein